MSEPAACVMPIPKALMDDLTSRGWEMIQESCLARMGHRPDDTKSIQWRCEPAFSHPEYGPTPMFLAPPGTEVDCYMLTARNHE